MKINQSMFNKFIYIALTVDVDPDPSTNDSKSISTWSGFEDGSVLILKNLAKIKKKTGFKIPISWFVRVDEQIYKTYGEYNYLGKKYNNFWKKVKKTGHEINWHPHLYKKNKKYWVNKTNIKEINLDLKNSYKEFKKIFGHPKCIRIGEARMSNSILKTIKKLKITADSSCIPGRKIINTKTNFDWSRSPNKPYYPSEFNYQINNKKNKNFCEIPMNTIYTKCSYDKKKIKRYINPCFQTKIIDKSIKEFIMNNKILVSIFHPYEIVKKVGLNRNKNLIGYDEKCFIQNIENIINICNANKVKIKFCTIGEIINELKKSEL